jgi:acyl carrier protein
MKKVQEFLDDLCAALNREPGSLNLSDTPNTVEEWDSVGHLAIISSIDSALGVSPDEEELRNFNSLRELTDRLKKRGALED